MIRFILKVLLFLIATATVLSIFLISDNNFFVAGGSDAADIIVRVPYTIRIGALVLTLAALAFYIFRTGKMTAVFAIACAVVFMLSQNMVRVSGKNFEVVQSFALVPVQRLVINDNPLADAASVTVSSTWCCLVSEQVEGRHTFMRGIWPLALPQDELWDALDGLIFSKHAQKKVIGPIGPIGPKKAKKGTPIFAQHLN